MGFLLFLILLLCSCTAPKVRYDAAPAPIDINHHTVLLSVERDQQRYMGFGQVGVSYSYEEPVTGKLTIYTPLPGTITMTSSRCGIDEAAYHSVNDGVFSYDLAKLFQGVPQYVQTCVLSILVHWELPEGWVSDHPLRGMTGRLYYRRRLQGQTAAPVSMTPSYKSVGPMIGMGFAQFRSQTRSEEPFPVSEPLLANINIGSVIEHGKYYLRGCGFGVESMDFTGDQISVTRENIIGETPAVGGCVLMGFVSGKTPTGAVIDHDVALGVEVFDKSAMLLSGSVAASNNQVCYQVENSVTGCILHHGEEFDTSNELSHCFSRVQGTNPILGCWSHKGRAVYAVMDGNDVEYVH